MPSVLPIFFFLSLRHGLSLLPRLALNSWSFHPPKCWDYSCSHHTGFSPMSSYLMLSYFVSKSANGCMNPEAENLHFTKREKRSCTTANPRDSRVFPIRVKKPVPVSLQMSLGIKEVGTIPPSQCQAVPEVLLFPAFPLSLFKLLWEPSSIKIHSACPVSDRDVWALHVS